jgi:hypothetical protein
MTAPRVPNIFEREAIQCGYLLDESYMVAHSGALKGIKIRQSALAPEDEIIVHPSIKDKILNNCRNNAIDISHFIDQTMM